MLTDRQCYSNGFTLSLRWRFDVFFSPDRDQKEFRRPKLEIYSQRMGSVSELFYRIIILQAILFTLNKTNQTPPKIKVYF